MNCREDDEESGTGKIDFTPVSVEAAEDSFCLERGILLEKIRFLGDRVDALMNIHHASILVIDPQSGKIIDGNNESIARYAGNRQRLLGMSVSEINMLPKSKISTKMKQAVSDRHHFEFKHKLIDGTIQDVDVYSGPIMFDGQQALISFIHDATERKALERKLHLLATTDHLTGCFNLRHFLSLLRREFRRARRKQDRLGFAIVDLDHFKNINDTFGHLVGDRLLRRISATLRRGLPDPTCLGRLGGEEFGILFAGGDRVPACGVADGWSAGADMGGELRPPCSAAQGQRDHRR